MSLLLLEFLLSLEIERADEMNIINYMVQDQEVVSENFLYKISILTLFNTNCRRQETQSLELECFNPGVTAVNSYHAACQ